MGIGHFLWSPLKRLQDKDQSFAMLIHYQEDRGITVPHWLQGVRVPPCPWPNRQAFLNAQNSAPMRELRQHLANTIASQSKFMLYRTHIAVDRMLATANKYDRNYLAHSLKKLTCNNKGLYVLIDYLNFKGLGLTSYKHKRYGWGLMSVLLDMRNAPGTLSTRQAFAWSANKLLSRRVAYSRNPQAKKWILGWRKRLKTYTL